MSVTIILQVLPLIFSLVLPFVAYWLGLKSQRIQALREYVADTVGDKYPALSFEINRNIGIFNDYLEDPLEHFDFPQLDQFYDEGLNEFMKKHHSDLFLSIDYLKQEIAPKLDKLCRLVGESIKKIYDKWNSELCIILPIDVKEQSTRIAQDLIRAITPTYVFKDLLNGRENAIRRKVEVCIQSHTAHIYQEKRKKMTRIVIHGLRQKEYVDYDKVFNSLLKTAESEISRIIGFYTELQTPINEKVKLELLPLLHKYISSPI